MINPVVFLALLVAVGQHVASFAFVNGFLKRLLLEKRNNDALTPLVKQNEQVLSRNSFLTTKANGSSSFRLVILKICFY